MHTQTFVSPDTPTCPGGSRHLERVRFNFFHKLLSGICRYPAGCVVQLRYRANSVLSRYCKRLRISRLVTLSVERHDVRITRTAEAAYQNGCGMTEVSHRARQISGVLPDQHAVRIDAV